jgi:starch synthase
MRFAFFSKAALEYMLKANKRPDVIHCHDWQTGLAPVLLFEMYKYCGMENQRVCFTVHNFRHQGQCGQEVLWATGLGRPEYYLHYDRLRDNFNRAALNLTKAGIVYSNFVTTVSPQHAWEAANTDQNFGLGHTVWIHRAKFGGVLNGVDYDTWNPEFDPFIARRYGIESLDLKYENKRALRERLWLRDGYKPIIAYVGRFDSQKGVHLVHDTLFYALHNGAQFVLVGPSPEPAINADFARLKNELNDNPDCHLELRFDPELAHLVFAGADLLVGAQPLRALWARADDRHEIWDRARRPLDRRTRRYRVRPGLLSTTERSPKRICVSPRGLCGAGLGAAPRLGLVV